MSAPALIDAEVLDDLIRHIGEEGARAVAELFIGECRELVAAMDAADPAAVRRAAHSLKSSAGQLGAAALSAAALAVESAGSGELASRIAGLASCAAATRAALTARLELPG